MAQISTTSLFSDVNFQHYYKFEDANDSKGSNNLTNTGSVPFNAAKYSNGGDLGTSNTTDWFSRADANGVAGNTDYSFAFWAKITTEIGAGRYTFFSVRTTTGASRYFDFYYDYNAGTRQLNLNASGTATNYTVTLGTAVFHHFVVIRNFGGSTTKIYLDGADVVSGTLGTGTDGSTTFGIGAETVAGGNPASLIIDDFGMWDRVLTADEVSTLYNEQGQGGTLNLDSKIW